MPFVGREAELDLLQNAYARAVQTQRAHTVTVFGEPGIGKSRLIHEFVEGVERATVLRGRSVNEAAAALDTSVDAVKSRVYYALRALRVVLSERGVLS